MAKLSEIYKVGMSADDVSKITNKNNGGGDSAPASYVPGKKLSDYYIPGMSAPTPKPVTRSTTVPSIAQSQTTSSQPTFDYEAIIKEYESLPNTNIFSRLFNKESEAAYNRKQELNPQYEQAKDIQTVKKLNSLGALDDVKKLWDTYEGHDEVYTPLYDLLKSKGVTDKKELNDLVNNIEAMQKREGIERANKYLTEYADEHPVLGSAFTVPTKMVTGLGSVAETGMNYVAGKPMSNASSVSLSGNKTANEMRNVVSDDMNGVGKFLYGSGMSMADMLANRWILGGLGNVGMGAEKYADTVNEAIDQGLNPTQIVGKGLASGATTYITEKMLTTKSLDAAKESILGLLKEGGLKALGKGGIVKVLLPILAKTGVAEGTQEGLENIADTIADAFIAGGKNELTQSYNQYKANGLSDSEALKKVAGDKALELLQDTAGGFLSGFLMGGAEMGKSGIEYKLNNRNNQNNLPGLDQSKSNTEVPTIQNSQQTETTPVENKPNVSPTFADDVAKIRKTLGDDVAAERDWSNQYAIDFKDSLETLKKTPTVQNYDNAVKALDLYEANLPEGANVDTNLRDALTNLSKEFGANQNATVAAPTVGENAPVEQPTSVDLPAINTQQTNTPIEKQTSIQEPVATQKPETKSGTNKIMKEDTGISNNKTKTLPSVTDESNKIETSVKDFVSSSRKEASQFAKTLEQNESFKTKKGKALFKKMLNDGTLDKETKSNAQAGLEAYENVERDGIEKRKEIIENSKTETTSTQLIEADIIGAEEVRNAIKTGDTASMSKFFGRLTQRVSDLGRALQAVKLFKDTATQTILGTHLLQNSAGKSLENRAKKKPNSKAAKTMKGIDNAAKELSDIAPKENRNKSSTENKPLNRKLANALSQLANGKQETVTKPPKTHEQIRQEVINTLEKMAPHKEWKDQRSEWTEQQIDAITSFVESGRVDVDTLAQEMKSVLSTNAFFTLDESTPLKPQKGNSKLQAAIDLLTNGRTEKERKEKNPAQIRREVEATLGADVDSFSDAGIEFLTMLANDSSISKEVIADEIEHYMNTGEFYTIDESTKVNRPKSSKLAKALNMNVESKMNTKTEARPKSFNTILEEVNNTLEDEGASVEFSDNAKQFLATLLEEKVDTQTIADEINHYLEHGTFFTIDESTNVPKPKSSKLLKALNLRVENKIKTPTETKPKSFNTILEEVNNTLDDEDASVFFSDSAKEFIATLIDERVDAQTIADEIDHYLENGSFYTLDESIDVPKPTSQRLQSILNEMGNDTPVQEKAPLTYDQIRERVKNTLDNEMSKVDFTDDEISYMARLMEQGATSEDIKQALIKKVTSGHFEMSPEDMKAIVEFCEMADKAPTSKESAQFKQKAAAIAAKYAPEPTFMDKWNAWRMTSMLLSLPTHVRNFAGNLNWGAVTNIKDAVGAVLEEAIIKDGGTRTKALLNKKTDADLIKASKEDFSNTVYEDLTESSKFTMKNAIERQKRIYKTKWLEKLRTTNSNALEAEDTWALERKYTKALARYLKANGYGAEVFKTNAPILDEARSYAIQAAKDSTFHADNALAKTLETWSRTARENGNFGLEVFIESNVPFKKTPVNIAVQGLRYTPGVGLIPKVAGTNVFQDIFSSQKNVNAFIDVLARQLTGGAIMALGAGLAAKGWLVSDRDEDEDDAFKKGSNYSIKFGDKSFTIDWLAPAALPLFIGAELYHAFSPNDDPKEDKKFFTALASLTEPIVETSMLQGLDNTLNSLVNAGKYKFPTLATNIVSGYASQALPTSLGQLARTIDPYRRTTRTATSNSVNPPLAALEKAGLKALNKLPGLSMLNEPYLDAWGEPQKNANGVFGGNVFGRAVQNFLLPGYFNDTSMTPREEKLATLEKTYEGTGSLIPSLADDNSPNGRRLSNSEYTRWAQVRGDELKKAVDSATAYKGKIPTSDLQDYVHELELFANVVARNKQFGTPIPKTYKKKYEAYKDGGYSYSAVMKYLIKNSK